jgi:hypothetical protein
MDPYLENPESWQGFHNSLIAALALDLAPSLRPRYYVATEERTYLYAPDRSAFMGRPDLNVVGPTLQEPSATWSVASPTAGAVRVELPIPDHVREAFLEVRQAGSHEVVTVLELLSPSNKQLGEGRRQYEQKRLAVFGSLTNFVEIDLLRAGEPMRMWGNGHGNHYRILVSRARQRPSGELYPFSVRQPVPDFPLPLRPDDAEPFIELNRILHDLYERAGFDLRINYRGDAAPPLEGEDATWADALLRDAGLRG